MSGLASILEQLPASLDWAVAFRLERLAAVVGTGTVRAAFGLPDADASHVVLTSAGPLLVRDGGLESYSGSSPRERFDGSLADRFSDLLGRLPPGAGDDCIGLGETTLGKPVLMEITLGEDGTGIGEAWFASRPSGDRWELLPAIGVRPLAPPVPAEAGGPWHARFGYSLVEHLDAARLAGFARTANCNRFFLLQGELGPGQREGLARAARDRIEAAGGEAYDWALGVAEDPGATLMTACGPAGREPYGDLVPLGILLAGIRRLPAGPPDRVKRGIAAVQSLRRRLADGARDDGWPFQAGTVTTGLDSALVLLGFRDRTAVPALERFREPSGGYAADRAGAPGPSTAPDHSGAEHWHGPDIATTSLAGFLRADAGLPETTPAAWLEYRFDRRGSPFIACPWLLDWLLSLGLAADRSPAGSRLRERLRAELRASRNEDGSFGRRDERVLATASACLALETLGERGQTLVLAQLALARAVCRDHTPAVPFFSAVRIADRHREIAVKALVSGRGVVATGGALFSLTTYEDSAGAVTAALVALALSQPGDLLVHDGAENEGPPHERYRCRSLEDYVSRFALL